MAPPQNDAQHFRAQTGQRNYDAIDFMAEPIADVILDRPGEVSIIRHGGLRCEGMVSSQSFRQEDALLIVGLTTIGRCRGRVGDNRIDMALRRGHIDFLPPGVDIDIEYPAAHSALMMYLPARQLAAAAAEVGASIGTLRPAIAQSDDRLVRPVHMIEQEMRAPGFASDLLVDGLLRAIRATLLARDSDEQRDDQRITLSPAKQRRVQDYVEANLDQPICLKDMAAIAGLSAFHFARVFKSAIGESPYHYIGSRRLARAQLLLTSTEMPLAELALTCGFANQSHFTAAFTRSIGVSPGRYRKEMLHDSSAIAAMNR